MDIRCSTKSCHAHLHGGTRPPACRHLENSGTCYKHLTIKIVTSLGSALLIMATHPKAYKVLNGRGGRIIRYLITLAS